LKDFAFIFEGIIKMSFSLTANGFIYTDANNQTKSIVIDGANNTIDFQQLNISTPSISNKEYVAPQSNFQPADKAALVTAVNLWVSDNATALATYGVINTWDTSLITDMSGLFQSKTTFNDNIGDWDTSSVTTMNNMFYEAEAFNQDISSWNTSKVDGMVRMFRDAASFNQNISAWDVGAVTDFTSMWLAAGAMLGANGDANRLAIHTAWNGNASWSYQWGGNNNP
jgi:surface protein